MELPAISRNEAKNAYAVEMTVAGQRQRNYTFLWNESHMTADWVAYPLCGRSGHRPKLLVRLPVPMLPLQSG